MICHQVIFTASQCSLDGGQGFGVRTATEGAPGIFREFVKKADSENSISYNAYVIGRFLPKTSSVLLESPERIYEYPRRYFHLYDALDKVHIVGRTVFVGFDFDFYTQGKTKTRPGNYLIHAFCFEGSMDKDVFSLLEGQDEGTHGFLPKDWTPVKTNEELLTYMAGKPTMMTLEDKPFAPFRDDVCKESVDLFFAYRHALGRKMSLRVAARFSVTAEICGGFLGLLPASVANETTFMTGYMEEGAPQSSVAKVFFVDELNTIWEPDSLALTVDYLNGGGVPQMRLADIWRARMEKAIDAKDRSVIDTLAAWIYSDIAADMQEKCDELNHALFDYCCNPYEFSLEVIDKVEEILPTIQDAVSRQLTTPARLMELLCNEFCAASSLSEYRNAIRFADKVEAGGFDVSAVIAVAECEFTSHLLASPANLADAVSSCDASILRKYADTAKFPSLNDAVAKAVETGVSVDYIVALAAFLEESAAERVKVYVQLLRETPSRVAEYSKLLDTDKTEAEKIDYITEFAALLSDASFAGFYYSQLMRSLQSAAPAASLKTLCELAECNQAFAMKLFSNLKVYDDLYADVTAGLDKNGFTEVRLLTEKYVLSLIPDSSARRKWQLLRDVIAAEPAEDTDVPAYYSLAVKYDADDAVRKIAPRCFESMSGADAKDVVAKLREKNALTDKDMLKIAASCKGRDKAGWLVAVAREFRYDYNAIAEASKAFGIKSSDDLRGFMKDHFKKEYAAHKRQVFMTKVKSLFSKKEK